MSSEDLTVLAWIIDRLYEGGSWMTMQEQRPEINDVLRRLRELTGAETA